jgi:hypothetical protein
LRTVFGANYFGENYAGTVSKCGDGAEWEKKGNGKLGKSESRNYERFNTKPTKEK